MQARHPQCGITLISGIVVLGVIAFLTMIVLKLFPVYMEHMNIISSLSSLEEERTAMNPVTIRESLTKRFQINDVKSVRSKDIQIERGRGVYTVRVAYEKRTPFISNVDFVVSFDDQVEVPAP